MSTPTVQPGTTSTTPPTVREEEQADEAKTADSAPAPVHPPRERKVRVRDAYGNDPHGGDGTGPDGERGEGEVGEAPYERPDPTEAALRELRAKSDKT